jgi:hypothetical protein
VDTTTGVVQTVVISKQWALSDLRADRLDADSVTVSAVSLQAQGVVRLTVADHGGAPFRAGLQAILFRDVNGNFKYDPGVDSVLGVQSLQSLDPGQSAVLNFTVNGTRLFPEELFFAWVDAGATAPEMEAGDHLAIGPSPCRQRKLTTWTASAESLVAPVIANGYFPGLSQSLGVRLWDTNGDSTVDDRDSAQVLWVSAGRIWLAHQGGDTIWTRPATTVGSMSDLAVRDVQGDGIPEILAGNQVWNRNGQLVWDGATTPILPLDLADEGLTDSVAVAGACVEVWSGQRDLLWSSSGCSRQGMATRVASIVRQPSGCSDVSVSAPKALLAGNGFTVRIANAGTVNLPAGVLVHLARSGVRQTDATTTRTLRPGEWEDVPFSLGAQVPTGAQWTAWADTTGLVSLGVLDSHASNNQVKWGN